MCSFQTKYVSQRFNFCLKTSLIVWAMGCNIFKNFPPSLNPQRTRRLEGEWLRMAVEDHMTAQPPRAIRALPDIAIPPLKQQQLKF